MPSGAKLAAAYGGTVGRLPRSASVPVRRAGAWLSSALSGARHRGSACPCSTDSTTGTTRVDLRRISNLCAPTRQVVGWR